MTRTQVLERVRERETAAVTLRTSIRLRRSARVGTHRPREVNNSMERVGEPDTVQGF